MLQEKVIFFGKCPKDIKEFSGDAYDSFIIVLFFTEIILPTNSFATIYCSVEATVMQLKDGP
jgi:hypothetical protein